MVKRKIPTPLLLSDVVKDAADQLRQIKAAEPDDPVMKFDSCEIELSVAATIEPGGKVKLAVVEFGADASYANTQKVTLKFSSAGAGITAAAEDVDDAPLPDPD